MPARTRGRPQQDVTSRPAKVQRSAARRSRLLTNICVDSDSDLDLNSDLETDLEIHSALKFDRNGSSREEDTYGAHHLEPNSVDDDEVIFVRETRVSKSVASDNISIPKKPTVSGHGLPASLDSYSLVTHATALVHVPQGLLPSSRAEAEAVASALDSLKRLNPGTAFSFPSAPKYPGNGNLFRKLPVETHQAIARFLPTDLDVINYGLICKATLQSVTDSIWFERFNHTFDRPENQNGVAYLAQLYKNRSELSRATTCFDTRHFTGIKGGTWKTDTLAQLRELQTNNGPYCLELLRDLIKESNAVKHQNVDGIQVIIGMNHEYIRSRILHPRREHRLDILGAVLNTHEDIDFWNPNKIISASKPDTLVLIVQLCLTYLFLDPATTNSFFQPLGAFEVAQVAVYADPVKQPVFVGKYKETINVRWLLSTVRFFRDHLLGDGNLTNEYAALDPQERPQSWLGKLKDETQTIGSHWKGMHTWLDGHELLQFRTQRDDTFFADNDEHQLSDLAIFFDEDQFQSKAWPNDLELLLSTNPYPEHESMTPQRTDRKLRSRSKASFHKYSIKSFFGTSKDAKPGHFYGRIHALPPQQGIPGFQRVSFVKFCYELQADFQQYDPSEIWGYEGCVLPGGRVIVGRWMDLSDQDSDNIQDPIDRFSGPFIYWNIDESCAEPPISPQEALNFLATLNDLGIAK